MKRTATTTDSELQFDFFICHASEDKKAVARPIAEALREHGYRVWYDEFALRLGDSLSASIDRGLAGSRFGVVILSAAFFAKKWPARELGGLVARQVAERSGILPIWHGVSKDQVLDYSPPLADVVAADTRNGLPSVLDAILQVAPQSSVGRSAASFRGNYPSSVRNGLISLPPAYRRGLRGPVVVTSFTGKSALVYPLDVWIRTESSLDLGASNGNNDDVERLKIARQFLSVVNLEKGAVQVREPLRTSARLFGDVDIMGWFEHVEVSDHQILLQRLRTDPFTEEDARALAEFGI